MHCAPPASRTPPRRGCDSALVPSSRGEDSPALTAFGHRTHTHKRAHRHTSSRQTGRRGSVGGAGAHGAVPGVTSAPTVTGLAGMWTARDGGESVWEKQRGLVAGGCGAEREKKEPGIGGEKGDSPWSDDRRETAKGKCEAEDAGGGGWMKMMLGTHESDKSKSLAWGTPQGLRYSRYKGTEHISGVPVVVRGAAHNDRAGRGCRGPGGAGAEASSPLRGAGVRMRKVGPQLPLQGTSDFPGLSQQGWWRCHQGVGTSPTPPWALRDGGSCEHSWMLTPCPEHGRCLGPKCKGSTGTSHPWLVLLACAGALQGSPRGAGGAPHGRHPRQEPAGGHHVHSTQQNAGTRTAAGFYFYTSPPCPLCRNDIIMGI